MPVPTGLILAIIVFVAVAFLILTALLQVGQAGSPTGQGCNLFCVVKDYIGRCPPGGC
ncbi:MAG: hypothetical protein HY366_00920 [Candidatus Aenigmarchaeota archaeon]|nr:hypothetical protein [Candidatus Aenigmarchaeota archaeon]